MFAYGAELFLGRLDALIFQSAAHLCLSVITSLTAVALYGPHMASLIAKAYFKSAGFVIFIVVTICHFLDVAVTPVPFRVLNILPVTWVTLILTIVTGKY